MPRRSIGYPLALGISLCLIAIALGVGWQILVVGNLRPAASGLTPAHWVAIVLGSLFAVLMISGLVLLCVWLVREILYAQRQQAFLDAVTHEMKTPLAALRLYLETLQRHDPPPDRRRAFLGRMQEDVARLERTIAHVLAAARAEEKAGVLPGDAIDLTALLHATADEVRRTHALPEEAIAIARTRPLVALGDAAQLAVVFRNLLENAVKYSEPPIEVRVALEETAEGRVRAEIADRGIGIEPNELRKIFRRFYRVGRDAAGLGLGLFIVHSLVRRNGGRVEARSEGRGRGSRFTVSLRAGAASAVLTPAPKVAPEAARLPTLGSRS